MVLNIITNAKDAILQNSVTEGIITISIDEDEKFVKVSVKDNAGGIKVEPIDKIYEPYFSTKDNKIGTGIGLYMSKTIIEERFGGTLTAINLDGGAIFVKNVVVGKFLISERKMSSEAYIKPSKDLKLKEKRNLKDYYVVGAAVDGDRILAYSREYSTLLSIDKNSFEVKDVYEMPLMKEPHSLAVSKDKLYVLGFENGKNLLYEIEKPF